MGYSQTVCQRFKIMDNSKQTLKCNTGKISEIVDWTFQTAYEDTSECARMPTDYCYSVLNQDFIDILKDKCVGRSNCTINSSNDNDFLVSETFKSWDFVTSWAS